MLKPVVLCILDGVGINSNEFGNAVIKANMPCYDNLWNNYPHCMLEASGEAVGLPVNTMGNSEVGHTNIGAGKIVYQPSQFINEEIKSGSFYKNEVINEALDLVVERKSSLHIIGLISEAGVHSLLSHLVAILEVAKTKNIKNVYIHGFSDGRDTNPKSALEYFDIINEAIKRLNVGKIATISGRYYGMDRDNRWDRVKKAYDALVYGVGESSDSYANAILDSYSKGVTDEFILPTIIDKEGTIKSGDVVIDFNFRPDRLRELLSALSNPDFSSFDTRKMDISLFTMMPVSNEVVSKNFYNNQSVNIPLGVCLSYNGKKQLRIAETEKYAHVTYFFDGGKELELDGCDRVLIPSPRVSTYDLSPKMSSEEITNELLSLLNKNIYDFVVLNYANGDMLGHTGNFDATVESLEFLDKCLEKIYKKISEMGGLLIVTADHGNCENMIDDNGFAITSHSTNMVPFIVCKNGVSLKNGKLSDIAPTILKIMDLTIPDEMSGSILIK